MPVSHLTLPSDTPTAVDHVIRRIAEATRCAPYEGRLYAVGGFLRDRWLRRAGGQEVDMVLEGDAPALASHLHRRGLSDHIPVTYPRFGTAMIQVGEVAVEFVTARRESYHESSRKPEVEPATVLEDALRRDFTINTLLQNIHTGELLDPTGQAINDLEAGILRTPLEPDQTFHDDPLRMLRAVRFASQLGFTIEPEVERSIRRCSARLSIISQERIRDEWNKTLLSDRPARGLHLMRDLELLDRFLPELLPGGHWDHILDLLGAIPSGCPLPIRTAVVLHHSTESKALLGILDRLRYARREAEEAALALDLRRRLVDQDPADWTDGLVRRWVRRAGGHRDEILQFLALDQKAGDEGLGYVDLGMFIERIAALEAVYPSAAMESPLDGTEIMERLQALPGPRVRDAKEWLLNEVLEGRLQPGDVEAASQGLIRRPS